MFTSLTRGERASLAAICLLALAGAYIGWRVFWFLTDDAYIAFRYISNSRMGYGYVWNPPPFRPVEGYTSFLWVVILDGVWRLTGIEPPVSANPISLVLSCLTLCVGGLMVLRIHWNDRLRPHRVLLLGLVWLGVVTNRTFLAWMSSGMETALFNFCFTLWIYCALCFPRGSRFWALGMSSTAALTYLARPEGILAVIATSILLGSQIDWHEKLSRSFLAGTPLLTAPFHLLWRRATYGEWLPNSYYAKAANTYLRMESGFHYLLSFIIEYSLWFWLALAGLFILRLVKIRRDKSPQSQGEGRPSREKTIILVLGVVITHFLYYTFVVGGDHFEYRVYSHLILLLFISSIYMMSRLGWAARLAIPYLTAFILASWVIPWTHWAITKDRTTRAETGFMKASVSQAVLKTFPGMPTPLIRYFDFYDSLQFWLIDHAVCMRHQEHKIFHLYLLKALPSREAGLTISGEGYPVIAQPSVGVLAWVLPHVNIIDTRGLNDYVIARNPWINAGLMAHERQAPPGYVECFMPNVEFTNQSVVLKPRPYPLTREKILQCEQQFALAVQNTSHSSEPGQT
jgi:arabinofuranosyltransferase